MRYTYVKMVEPQDNEEHVYLRVFESTNYSNASTSQNRFPLSVIENMVETQNFKELDVWLTEFNLPNSFPFEKDLTEIDEVNSWNIFGPDNDRYFYEI